MGWDGYKTSKPIAELILERLEYSGPRGSYKVLDQATRGTATYAALQVILSDDEANGDNKGKRYVTGAVVLHRKDSDGTIMFKDMDETVHPYYYDCPKRILDRLTPVAELPLHESGKENCAKWRQLCNAKRTGAGLPANGQVLKFETPLSFGTYGEFDTFRVFRTGKKVRFAPIKDGRQLDPIYKITNLDNHRFSAVG